MTAGMLYRRAAEIIRAGGNLVRLGVRRSLLPTNEVRNLLRCRHCLYLRSPSHASIHCRPYRLQPLWCLSHHRSLHYHRHISDHCSSLPLHPCTNHPLDPIPYSPQDADEGSGCGSWGSPEKIEAGQRIYSRVTAHAAVE
ncbi:hypothetical protein EmuJ_000407700 [Echinococcus multilocularis]|uniref:Uncharacterized protein n=1 Tax=Echinococcus multilocularis TaxID=6211 RepID=A0A068XXA4_ECHMU|nr:hypothetical protein EmuJ_000407700 [Echinococcus multilocularis]